MTIEGLEKGIQECELEVKAARTKQQAMHDAAESKRKMLPILATPLDQHITPGQGADILKWLGTLPSQARELIKKTLEGDK